MARRLRTEIPAFVLLCIAAAPTLAAETETPRPVNLYGSLRVAFGTNFDQWDVRDNLSRAGLTLHQEMDDDLFAIARYELGLNLVNNNESVSGIIDSGEGPSTQGQDRDAVTTRLGWVGVSWRDQVDVQIGKQWSPYFEIGVWTDMLAIWGPEGQGTFATGTDGGLSGTGRAARAIGVRARWRGCQLATQWQPEFRDDVINHIRYGESESVSLLFAQDDGLSAGVAYHHAAIANVDSVGDWAPPPGLDGDAQNLLGSVRFTRDGWYVAACAGRYENQAIDDAGTAFDAWGCEVVALRAFSARWQGVLGWNHLAPDDDGYAGRYRLDYQVLELRYRFGPHQSFFCANYQINNGRSAEDQARDDVVAGCFYYYF
jgi:predicted porin